MSIRIPPETADRYASLDSWVEASGYDNPSPREEPRNGRFGESTTCRVASKMTAFDRSSDAARRVAEAQS